MRDVLLGKGVLGRSPPALPTKRLVFQTLNFYLDKTIHYRRNLWRGVNGSFALIRYLSALNIPLHFDDDYYLWNVAEKALKVSNTLGFTSLYGPGRVHRPGIFYGPGVNEIIMVTTSVVAPEKARADWQNLEPLTVITHPYNDFTLPYLAGTGEGLRTTPILIAEEEEAPPTVVIHLDASLLAFQYKCWWEANVRDVVTDSVPGMNLFFHGWPLANLLRSHIDQTVANRAFARFLGQPIQEQVDPNPYYVNYQVAYVDRMLSELSQYLHTGRLSFDDVLTAIPMPSGLDYHARLRIPGLAYVTQVEWAIFMSQIRMLHFLLAYNQKEESKRNLTYVNYIRHWVIRMMNGRLFSQGLRGEDLDDAIELVRSRLMAYL